MHHVRAHRRRAASRRWLSQPFTLTTGDTYFITFLKQPPPTAVADALVAASNDFDTLEVHGRDVHWHMRGKSTDTQLKPAVWKQLGEHASTSRNVNMLTQAAGQDRLTVHRGSGGPGLDHAPGRRRGDPTTSVKPLCSRSTTASRTYGSRSIAAPQVGDGSSVRSSPRGGPEPVASFQPTRARRALAILAAAVPRPPAIAQTAASGHEN